MVPSSALNPRESSGVFGVLVLKLVNTSPWLRVQVLCKLLPLCLDLEWVCMRALLESSLRFPSSSGSSRCEPCWFSESDIMEVCLPGEGPQSWGAHCGAQTPSPEGEPLHLWFLSFLWVATLEMWVLLLPFSVHFFLYIHSCRRAVLLVFRFFS